MLSAQQQGLELARGVTLSLLSATTLLPVTCTADPCISLELLAQTATQNKRGRDSNASTIYAPRAPLLQIQHAVVELPSIV